MKLLVVLAMVGMVSGKTLESPVESPIELDYHNKIGIPLAARIKAAEEALDFDGARIVGGSPAALGQYPYVGGLIISMVTGQTSVCTSSLLSTTRALTAAHCWRMVGMQASSFTVVLGTVLLFTGGTRVTTSDVVVHPGYNDLVLNDIAMIRFPPISFSNTILPINIATGSNTFVGSIAWAAGYGVTGDGHSVTTSQFLSHVYMPVADNSVCVAVYGNVNFNDGTLCADTSSGRGTCQSDSGGPLVIGNLLIGVTSFGHFSGCETGFPNVFARVTHFADWILSEL